MSLDQDSQLCVHATVVEVLPGFGLAYVSDERQRSWAVTKATPGIGLEALEAGQRLRLRIEHHELFSLVTRYDLPAPCANELRT